MKLSIDIPSFWLPGDEIISPPRPMCEDLCLSEEQDVARAWVRNLRDRTKLLAVDFDLTCIDLNTRGVWQASSQELAGHFRPLVRAAMLEACSIGIRVAVVSFSPQTHLIVEVLQHALPEVADQIMVRAGPPQAIEVQQGEQVRNKQRHIASVLEQLEFEGLRTELHEVMLVDDDFTNISDAKSCGCGSAWFNPEEALAFVCDLCQCRDEAPMFACHLHSHTHARSVSPASPMMTA